MAVLRSIFLAAITFFATHTLAAVSWQFDSNGKLVSASGLVVGSGIYDVEFRDGSCVSIFDGCDQTSDFDFSNEASARSAASALLSQVLLDIPGYALDSEPTLTAGCSLHIECFIVISYGSDPLDPSLLLGAAADNTDTVAVDGILSGRMGGKTDDWSLPAPFTDKVYARFTSQAIPEPGSMTLVALGLVAAGAARRRRAYRQPTAHGRSMGLDE